MCVYVIVFVRITVCGGVFVCVCVSMCMWACVFVGVSKYVYVRTCARVYIHAYVSVCLRAHVCACVYICVCISECVCVLSLEVWIFSDICALKSAKTFTAVIEQFSADFTIVLEFVSQEHFQVVLRHNFLPPADFRTTRSKCPARRTSCLGSGSRSNRTHASWLPWEDDGSEGIPSLACTEQMCVNI